MSDEARKLGPLVNAQWEEMPHNRMAAFWHEVATLEIAPGRRWLIGSSMGSVLLLFTDIPHEQQPDGKGPLLRTKTFSLNLLPIAQAAAETLVE